ncbi:hypothetical protein TREMEDRAFT_34776, partial [Tremella mesenterica DSM 1558]|uniref:uncharacterized protein n=1 Tax=Tremella mesenterica (strain ATCC 24925 / CBS 8224 / DSM 1558 / NBRC 9311 / NRRL Y-6157 / RJB 2259-6 / UBC 559-6) TaxID=578456 RepID=UPI00032CAA24
TERDILEVIPNLEDEISKLLQNPPFEPFDQEDAKVVALCRWFKKDYMKWVDPIPCASCGGMTESDDKPGTPTEEELAEKGKRVELHKCLDPECGGMRRFVRYGSVKALLRTREGRCVGEWAHLFHCFLQVSKIRARYVWNSEDHVWCEYYSSSQKHWVHVDPCEAAVNQPMLYDQGWGKKQAFCLAYGRDGAEDVTPVYVSDFSTDCQIRRRDKGWPEFQLEQSLKDDTTLCRLQLPLSERLLLLQIDKNQADWVAEAPIRLKQSQKERLNGRISGPEKWRKARDELGLPESNMSKPKIRMKMPLGYQTFGNPIWSEKEGLILTSGPDQTSALYSLQPVSQSTSWKLVMDFKFEAPIEAGESGAADGIAVVFSSERKLGEGGFGLGYSGIGKQGDFAIEIDTYLSQDHAQDPPIPHISIHSPLNAHHRNSLSCSLPGQIPFLSDGILHTLEIYFKASSRHVRVYLQLRSTSDDINLDRRDGEGSLMDIEQDEKRIELKVCDAFIPFSEGDWFLGFTGSCGGLWQRVSSSFSFFSIYTPNNLHFFARQTDGGGVSIITHESLIRRFLMGWSLWDDGVS